MKVSDMHMLRTAGIMPKGIRKNTPLAKEIESRREEMIRGILQNTHNLVNKQLEVAALPVTSEGKDNDTVLKASTQLLDRAFGKPKESIDFTGNVQFSLKELAQKRLEVPNQDIPLEELM